MRKRRISLKEKDYLLHNDDDFKGTDARLGTSSPEAPLVNLAGDPVRRLLAEGETLLEAGRADQAVLAFERVLLQDPAHEEARSGLERARADVTEAERQGESHLDEAERALDAGDLEAAHRHLDAALAASPSRPRALAILDRLDRRSGRMSHVAVREPSPAAFPPPRPGPHWSRRAFVATWGLALASLVMVVTARWDDLLGRLTRAPRPSQATVPPTLGPPAASVAGRAVADAQRRLEKGDPAGALAALERVRPEDPLYPYAQQLRLQSETARRGADAR